MRQADLTQDELPQVTLRIPGLWEGPEDLQSKLPEGFSIDGDRLRLPGGDSVEIYPLAADDEFVQIFATSCHRMPSPKDRETIEKYKVNVCLKAPGGSYEAARRMLQAGAAIIHAGGAGVFVDNSGVAHGSDDWLALAADDEMGGAYWAFVNTIGSEDDIYTLGMHVLGLRDAVMPRSGDNAYDHATLNSFLGYTYQSGEELADGDALLDPRLPTVRVHKEPVDDPVLSPGAPMFNPYGRWRLEPVDPREFMDNDEPEAS